MHLTFGKYRGMLIESLVLKEPGYALWLLGQIQATGDFAAAREEVARLVEIFDGKPILKPCSECGEPATRCSLYRGSARPCWFCDGCDPDGGCPSSGNLRVICTYLGAAEYAGSWSGGKADLKALIKEMARAKGLPERVGEDDARYFFYVPSPPNKDPEFEASMDEYFG